MKNKKMLKRGIVFICIIFFGVVMINLEGIRDVAARHFQTVSVINAEKRMLSALEERYPNNEFELISGSYTDAEGNDDDACYTGDYIVDNEEDSMISVVYSDKDFSDIWNGNVQISIQEKAFERKCSLIKRLSSDFTEEIKEDVWEELEPYILNASDISVKSFYQDPDYPKELPQGLEYGMEFDKDLALDFQFCMTIQIYEEGQEEQIAGNIIRILNQKGFSFYQYDISFPSSQKIEHYYFDETGELINKTVEKI